MSKFKGLWDDDDDDAVVACTPASVVIETNYKELYEEEHRRREELEQLVVMLKGELKNLRQKIRNNEEDKQASNSLGENEKTNISQSSSTELLTEWDKLALEEKERKQKLRRQKQMSGSNRGKLMSRRTQQSNVSNPTQTSAAAPEVSAIAASDDVVQKVSVKQSTTWSSDSSNFDSSSDDSDSDRDSDSDSDDSGFDESMDSEVKPSYAANNKYTGLSAAELDLLIDREILEWARSNTFITMLQNIKQVYSGKLVVPNGTIDETTCRKAYLHIIRQIHPDKVNKPEVESHVKIQSLKLSTCLGDAYNSYKQT